MKKKILGLLLALVLMVSLLPNALAAKVKQPTFTDVGADMWCFDNVEYVAKKGYFQGTTPTTFNPNGTMTRQQFVTVLARMAGVKVDNSKTAFSDVPAGSYSAGSVAWAAQEGIVTGYADGTFKPTAPVTRQQMSAFMSRFMDYYAKAKGVYFLKKPTVSSFADYGQVADYAKEAVDRCRAYGLIQGYAEDNTFRPAKSATRAHVAAVIFRLDKIMQRGGGGGFVPNPGEDINYTLTYINNNVAAGAEPTKVDDTQTINTNTATEATFEVKTIGEFDSNLASGVFNAQKFVQWINAADETDLYAPDQTITLQKDAPNMTLVADWAPTEDLLYWAIYHSIEGNDEANKAGVEDKLNSVIGKVDPTVPYAAVTALEMDANATIDTADNSRKVGFKATGELSTDVVSRMIETAAYYAVSLIGTPAEFTADSDAETAANGDAVTKDEVKSIVSALLDVLDPNMIWWEGNSRTEKVENLATKIYNTLKDKALSGKDFVGALWSDNFKYQNAVLFSEVDLLDKNGNLVITAKNDMKLYDAADNQVRYVDAVKRIAKAVAKELKDDLVTKTTYQTDLNLAGDLTLKFTMNEAQNIAYTYTQKNFPTTYHVKAELNLVQAGEEDYLAYKFVNGRPYVKLIITTKLQEQYEQSVNAMAQAAMTNGTAKAFVSEQVIKTVVSMVDSMSALADQIEAYGLANPGEGETYILKELGIKKAMARSAGDKWELVKNGPVDEWIDINLSTWERGQEDENGDIPYPDDAPYYLPFDFFWYRDGEVDANGNITSVDLPDSGVAPTKLFDNRQLTGTINDLVDGVIAAVLADKGISLQQGETLKAGIQRMINDALAGVDVKATIEGGVTDVLKTNAQTAKTSVEANKEQLINEALSQIPDAMKPAMEPEIRRQVDELINTMLENALGILEEAFQCQITFNGNVAVVTGVRAENIDSFLVSTPNTGSAERDLTLTQLQDSAKAEIEAALNNALNTALPADVKAMVAGDAAANTYLKNKILVRGGMPQYADLYYYVHDESAVIDDLVEGIKADFGVDADSLNAVLDSAIKKASGVFSQYLNKVSTAKSFRNLTTFQLGRLIDVMKYESVLGPIAANVTPGYVEAVAKAISKIEGNPSSITINGVTVSGMAQKVQDVKNAANGRKLCEAVIAFLDQPGWNDMSIATFDTAEGVEIDVVADAKGYHYEKGMNFVIDVE